MANKQQMTGMLGVYLTAVELTKRGYIVSPTSRSAVGADLLVTDQGCRTAWSVQVKTNSDKAKFWLVGEKAREIVSSSHVYVFVNARQKKQETPEFYIVPSAIVAERMTSEQQGKKGHVWHSYWLDADYLNNWAAFGSSN